MSLIHSRVEYCLEGVEEMRGFTLSANNGIIHYMIDRNLLTPNHFYLLMDKGAISRQDYDTQYRNSVEHK